MIELFSSREFSTAIWAIVFLILILIMATKNIEIRKSIHHLIKAATKKFIIIFLFITFFYVTFCIILLSNLSIWDWIFLKDVILWVLFIGIPICINAITERNKQYFRNLIRNNLKLAIFIEFLVGTFTFSIVAELLLVPIATLLFLFYAMSKTDENYKPTEKLFSFLLNILGLVILFYAGRSAIQSYPDLNILELLIIFSLPITMTFAFLPLAYCFAIYSEYEMLFIRLKFRIPEEELRKNVKWKILKTCSFSLRKVQYFSQNFLMKFYSSMQLEDVDGVIDSFNFSYKEQLNLYKLINKK